MSLLGFLLLMGLAAPQNQQASVPSSGDGLAAPIFAARQFNTLTRLEQRRLQQAFADARRDAQLGICYAIKSYIFEREDGNAPVLVATTTCTPANTLRWRQVDRAPKVRLIPAR